MMTAGHEDNDFLVRVRAQVMMRDETTEGWLPLSGGGLAYVSIRKRARLPPDMGGYEYIIFGQRISDQTVILSCVINRDLQYFKVMPTFHHWRTNGGKQRNGLTFQTAADARAFDKGIIRAYDDLLNDGADSKSIQTWDKYDYKNDSLVGEDDVFMTLDLPCESSRTNSEGSGSQKSEKQASISYISSLQPTLTHPLSSPVTQQTPLSVVSTNTSTTLASSKISTISGQTEAQLQQQQHHQQQQQQLQPEDNATTTPIAPGDNYSYVQLTAVHDYNYPVVDDPPVVGGSILRGSTRRDSTCSLKKRAATTESPSLIMKQSAAQGMGNIKTRLRCRYCQDFYTEEWNRRGQCEHAPDCFKSALEKIPGMTCARGMVYHCMSDAEGDTVAHPCVCSAESGCTKRWFGLALLSLLLPCLWCYPPLRACHYIGMSCGICGGKHKSSV